MLIFRIRSEIAWINIRVRYRINYWSTEPGVIVRGHCWPWYCGKMTLLAFFLKNTSINPQMGQGGKHLSLSFDLFNFSVCWKLSFLVWFVTDYLADDQDCGKIPAGILIVGPLGFYHNFSAKILAVRIILIKYLKPVKPKT